MTEPTNRCTSCHTLVYDAGFPTECWDCEVAAENEERIALTPGHSDACNLHVTGDYCDCSVGDAWRKAHGYCSDEPADKHYDNYSPADEHGAYEY